MGRDDRDDRDDIFNPPACAREIRGPGVVMVMGKGVLVRRWKTSSLSSLSSLLACKSLKSLVPIIPVGSVLSSLFSFRTSLSSL